MQTGIETLERRNVEGLTSKLRENILTRIGSNLQHRESGETNTRVQSNRPHSLEKKEFINELCVQLKQGSFDVRNNFVKKLYGCLKNHPDYKGDLVFNQSMDVTTIANLIEDKLKSLYPEDLEFLIEVDDYDEKNVTVSAYRDHDMNSCQSSIPLKWMMKLRTENIKLYKIIRNVISVVKYKYNLHDWGDGFSEMAQETYFEQIADCTDHVDFNLNKEGFLDVCSASDIDNFKKWHDTKFVRKLKSKDGAGYLFLAELYDIREHLSEEFIMNQINSYKPRNNVYKTMFEWAKKGMELYRNHDNVHLHDLIFIANEEYEEGTPVIATDFLKFEWDFRCPFWECGVEQWLNDHAGQNGVIETREHSILKENEYIDKFGDKYKSFGKELEEWFGIGHEAYYSHIWDWEKR